MLTKEKLDRYKKQSLMLSKIYLEGGVRRNAAWLKKRAERVRNCSNVWAGKMCDHCGKIAHVSTFACADKLCPICSVRKSRVTAAQAFQVLPYLEGKPILITLTQANVPGDELGGMIDGMSDAWSLIRRHGYVGRNLLSWAKTTEITYNDKRQDFHPHIHIIAYVPENETSMLTNEFWMEKWRTALDLDYNPVVDVRPVTNEKGAVCEVSKYVSKVHKFFELEEEQRNYAILCIADATYRRRLRAFGGQWREARRQLKLKDPDQMTDAEINAEGKKESNVCCGEQMRDTIMAWSYTGYRVMEAKESAKDETG